MLQSFYKFYFHVNTFFNPIMDKPSLKLVGLGFMGSYTYTSISVSLFPNNKAKNLNISICLSKQPLRNPSRGRKKSEDVLFNPMRGDSLHLRPQLTHLSLPPSSLSPSLSLSGWLW